MTIQLNSLRFHAYHGVLPQERKVGGDYEVSLGVELPAPVQACRDDRLEGTVDYARLHALVGKEMAVPAQLLEHVAWRICTAVLDAFPQVEHATVSLTKVNPPLGAACKGATVTLDLGREEDCARLQRPNA